MWGEILKRRTLVMQTIKRSYENLGYEYLLILESLQQGELNHHLVFHLGRNELANLIYDILEENERRNTLERFELEGFRVAMQNPAYHTLVNFFSHIVYQLTFDEVKNLVENNDDLLLVKLVLQPLTIYKFVDGSPEIYRNVVRESELIQKEIDDRRY